MDAGTQERSDDLCVSEKSSRGDALPVADALRHRPLVERAFVEAQAKQSAQVSEVIRQLVCSHNGSTYKTPRWRAASNSAS
jgi:hypothetical protein